MSSPSTLLNPLEAAHRQRRVLLRVLRSTFFVLLVTFTMLSVLRPPQGTLTEEIAIRWWIPLNVAVLFFLAGLGVDLATPRKKVSTLFAVILGILAGMLATAVLSILMDLLLQGWVADDKAFQAIKPVMNFIMVLTGMTLCYLSISTILQTQDDFRLVIPYVEFAKQVRGARPLLLDSSVLIDARIADVGNTGFITSPVVIPRFIIGELQQLADSGDEMKRARGRRGLDVATRLQRIASLDLSIDESPVPGLAADQMLVELARQMSGIIVSGDIALSRVAAIHGIPTLNLNELANALKPAVIPGEQVQVRLIRRGEQPSQGVGYLADGTMVVAENGLEAIGQEVTLVVTSTLQTSAGKLIFGRLMPEPAPESESDDIGGAGEDARPVDVPPREVIGPPPAAGPTTQGAEPASADAAAAPPEPRTPYPPKPPRTIRAGTPRNPRR